MAESLTAAMLVDAPSALWPMDDVVGSTTARDISGNNRPLTYVGGPTLNNAELLRGDTMRVWSPALNGGDYAQISPVPAWINPGSGDFLFTCWFRGTTVNPTATTFDTLFNLDLNDTGNGIDIYMVNTWTGANTGSMRIWYAGAVQQSTVAQQGVSVFDGNPHLLWFEKRSGTVATYFDGVLCTSGAAGTPTVGAALSTRVGSSYGQGNTYGLHNPIGYVGIWSGVTIPAAARRSVYLTEGRRVAMVVG